MLLGIRRTFFSQFSRAAWLAGTCLLLAPVDLLVAGGRSSLVCREDLSPVHREELAVKLRKITGLTDLEFDYTGTLSASKNEVAGGSKTARDLILNAIDGRNAVVLEDASNRSDVAFCRVIAGRWKKASAADPPGFVVQIDFVDFERLIGDERALEAFNVGWGFLHELDHIVNNSADAASDGETGECEAHLNQMRRESNLPERTNYFYTLSPLTTDSTFITRLVRLAFEEPTAATNKKAASGKKKRYWLTWDATVVGGLERNQVAGLR
ncbi:MAG TPA: hypothetical protein VMZ30_12370 [Pyrinomonadaceae bacterium]|nr:hypothetical protein [Pyrinomonadaceae bacterium]